jgi:hypothetical protein
MVQLSGCRLVGAVPVEGQRTSRKTANKEADETLYNELTWLGGLTAFPPQEADCLAQPTITCGKRSCQCTLRRLRIVRCEFGSSSCSGLALCLIWMLGRDDQSIASWKPRLRQAGYGRGRLRSEVVASAPNSASWRAACVVTLCFRLTMSRWQIFSAAIATRAARQFCPDAMTSEQFAPAPLRLRFPCFSFSSIDAPRGVVGWRRCCSPCIFAGGERVYHAKQNDHRRFPPGGNQGGGPTGKSRRGV